MAALERGRRAQLVEGEELCDEPRQPRSLPSNLTKWTLKHTHVHTHLYGRWLGVWTERTPVNHILYLCSVNDWFCSQSGLALSWYHARVRSSTNINTTCREHTSGSPVNTETLLCVSTELTKIQSFLLSLQPGFGADCNILWTKRSNILHATCRKKKKKIFICWQPGAGPANYTWPQVLLILCCFSLSDNTLLKESWSSRPRQIVL